MNSVDKNLSRQWNRRNALKVMATAVTAAPLSQFGSAMAQESPKSIGKYVSIDGNRIYIEDRGAGIPIVMGAGGQNRLETLRPLAEKLAKKFRVITVDRANLGRADVVLKGARDLDIWSDQLAGLIQHLGLRPAYLIGASSASRAAYTTALRYPDHTRGLLTYLTTGGGIIGERLAEGYYYKFATIAEEGGMQAIIEVPFWAERIALNADNKQRISSMDPKEFAAIMRRWGSAMRSSDTMIGINADGCRQLKANGTPIAIVQGCEESNTHRRDRSELYAQLTGATLIPTPVGFCEEASIGPKYDQLIVRPEVPESPPFRAYEMISMLPVVIDEFIQNTEAAYKARGFDSNAFSLNDKKEPEDTTTSASN